MEIEDVKMIKIEEILGLDDEDLLWLKDEIDAEVFRRKIEV